MDRLTRAARSALMSRIRGDDLKPETALAAELARRRLGARRNVKSLPGTPDIVLPAFRFAVFVHSCYWHGCPRHYRLPKTNKRFWREKLQGNRRRDERVRRRLRALGYGTAVVWEHDLRKGARAAADRIQAMADRHLDRLVAGDFR